ncbi:MAG: hypothetical protein OXC93_14415 [Rhodospirillaceae bacterium]|nr:hypothetical protein [Rhodospirillaceae bacterium]
MPKALSGTVWIRERPEQISAFGDQPIVAAHRHLPLPVRLVGAAPERVMTA